MTNVIRTNYQEYFNLMHHPASKMYITSFWGCRDSTHTVKLECSTVCRRYSSTSFLIGFVLLYSSSVFLRESDWVQTETMLVYWIKVLFLKGVCCFVS